jgi:hypothetical protein
MWRASSSIQGSGDGHSVRVTGPSCLRPPPGAGSEDDPHLPHRQPWLLPPAGGPGGCVPLPPSCGGWVSQPPPPGWQDRRDHHVTCRQNRETGVTVRDRGAAARQAASAATSAPQGEAETAVDQRVPKYPLSRVRRPTRCNLAADQTSRLVADASMLAARAATRTSERASVTLTPLVPGRTITPHTAETGRMPRPFLADRIAGNVQRLAAGRAQPRSGRAQPRSGSWLLIRKARISPLFASLSSHCSAVGLAFEARG